jgi:hypothetical protein
MDQSKHAPFRVAIRCRASNHRESTICRQRFPERADSSFRSVLCCGNRVCVVDPDASAAAASAAVKWSQSSDLQPLVSSGIGELRSYEYHLVFGTHAGNAEVYQRTAAPLVRAVRDGYNASCFAYGMTGAGKTHTMLGSPSERGLCGLAAEDLFSGYEKESAGDFSVIPSVTASYLEIYNEKLCDLLCQDNHKNHASDLDIVEDPSHGITVPHAAAIPVRCAEELEVLLDSGSERRTKASTASNVVSSRSHAILILNVRRKSSAERGVSGKGTWLQGKLCLIDLAGSERASAEFSNDKQERRIEGANINKSLLALGNCITSLGKIANAKTHREGPFAPTNDEKKFTCPSHVPYRDSKLTRLLQESLGGNTQTVMIGCISESCICFEETLSTLKYASRAKSITRLVHRNMVSITSETHLPETDYSELVVKLRDDVRCLRTQLSVIESTNRRLGLLRVDQNSLSSEPRAPSENLPLWDRAREERTNDIDAHLEIVKSMKAQLQILQANKEFHKTKTWRRIFSPAPQIRAGTHFDPARKIDDFLS